MAFRVVVTLLARMEIDEAAGFIAEDSPIAAAKWASKLSILIISLREMPTRFALIPEADELKLPYRSASHFSHRVIFRIDESANIVYVVRIYHGARKPLAEDDLE